MKQEIISKNQEGQFVRYEDKYLLTQQAGDNLIPLLGRYLNNASPVQGTQHTIIESIYFDNNSLTSLQEYLDRQNTRSKIRIRRYAPDAVFSNDIFVEIKSKTDGISKKNRILISQADRVNIEQAKPLIKSVELQQLNSILKPRRLDKRINDINVFIEKLKVFPICKVIYSRRAFARDDFRVTLDKDLSFEILSPISNDNKENIINNAGHMRSLSELQKVFTEKFYILEVKHTGLVPTWLSDFLSAHGIAKESFSKYTYCMSFALLSPSSTVKRKSHSL